MTFAYRDGVLCAEDVSLEEIARRFGTPCYVYSRAVMARNYARFSDALAGQRSLIAYSVKANANLAVLALMAQLGAGFDIVSGGELARVLAAGGDPRKVLFSGVGKTESEIELALRAGILCLNRNRQCLRRGTRCESCPDSTRRSIASIIGAPLRRLSMIISRTTNRSSP